MRVTNSMLVSNFLNDLNTNMNRLEKINSQLASGKSFAHISDDPVAFIFSSEARYKLSRLEHYQAGVESAQEWLTQVESGVMELNDVIKNALEACTDAATDVKTDSDKAAASEYIGQLRDHLLTTLNTAFGDKYVFGGYNTTGSSSTGAITGPFTTQDVSGSTHLFYNGFDLSDPDLFDVPGDPAKKAEYDKLKSEVLTFNVGAGLDMDVTVNGIDLVMFKTTDSGGNEVTLNMFNVLDDLYNAMKNGASAEELNGYVSKLQDGQNHLLAKTAEIGGKTNRLDLLKSRYDNDYINYKQMLSDAEDGDYAEILMNFKMAESVYQAALSAGAQIIQPTLMDFLR